MKNVFSLERQSLLVSIVGVAVGVFCVVALAEAATTISTSISTGGTLSVGDTSTLTGAVTAAGALNVFGISSFGGTATTTISAAGVPSFPSSAAVGTSLTVGTTITVGTIASTSKLIVGGDSTNGTINGIVYGYCTFAAASVTASSTKMFSCDSAAGVRSGDRIMVQATSSLPGNFVVQHASSTANNTIQVDIYNTGYLNGVGQGASVTTGVNSLNFWAVR